MIKIVILTWHEALHQQQWVLSSDSRYFTFNIKDRVLFIHKHICVAAWENPPQVIILTFKFFYISIKFRFLAVEHFLNLYDSSFRSKVMRTSIGICQKTQKWENRLQSWTFQTFHFMPEYGFIIQNHMWCVPMISHIKINITWLKRTSWALISC